MADFDPNKKYGKRKSGGKNFRKSGRSGGRDFKRSGGRDSGRSNRSERTTMHEAVCDKCGKKCEVPFNPTEGKPVYCSDCFRSIEKPGSKDNLSARDFEQINEKLDKIMKALKIDL